MPLDKDRKRIIRHRMAKTGESYTTARAHVIARKTPKRQPVAPVRLEADSTPVESGFSRTVRIDYAALAGMSDDKVVEKTGRSWQQWTAVLDADKAAALPHRDLARLVHEKYGVGNWWTQMVAVGYERIKGLREIGQRRGGTYEASRSRTFNVPVTVLFDAWADAVRRRRWLGAAAAVRTATRPKSMRLKWPDGTIVAVWFESKGDAKSTAGVQHMKLPDKAAADRTKAYWTDRFDALTSLLAD